MGQGVLSSPSASRAAQAGAYTGEGLKAPPAPLLMFTLYLSREGLGAGLCVHKGLKATNGPKCCTYHAIQCTNIFLSLRLSNYCH